MSSAHPDSGLPAPAPHEAPLSAAEATRLLDSIRQAEHDLAVTGEHIAVSPATESAATTPESDNSDAATEAEPAAQPAAAPAVNKAATAAPESAATTAAESAPQTQVPG
ncbi:hypothetical protein C6575_30030, partial [Nocardia seriolae]